MHKRSMLTVVMVMIGFGLAACNLPSRTDTIATPQNAAYTAVAETIVAQLTQVASPGTTNEAPEETSVSTLAAASSTVAPASPTFTLEVTPTSSPTGAVTSTPTTGPAATSSPSDIRQTLGDPDWQDTFKNANNWSVYEDDHVRFRINNNRMIMVAFNPDGRDSWVLSWPHPTSYYLEITGTTETCSGLDRYGIIFRSDADVGYLFGLACDGSYSLRSWDGEKFQALVNWTPSDQAKAGSGQTNRLGVRVDGDDILLYINGIHQATVQDDEIDEDSFGVFVGSRETANFRVELSEIAYWEFE